MQISQKPHNPSSDTDNLVYANVKSGICRSVNALSRIGEWFIVAFYTSKMTGQMESASMLQRRRDSSTWLERFQLQTRVSWLTRARTICFSFDLFCLMTCWLIFSLILCLVFFFIPFRVTEGAELCKWVTPFSVFFSAWFNMLVHKMCLEVLNSCVQFSWMPTRWSHFRSRDLNPAKCSPFHWLAIAFLLSSVFISLLCSV